MQQSPADVQTLLADGKGVRHNIATDSPLVSGVHRCRPDDQRKSIQHMECRGYSNFASRPIVLCGLLFVLSAGCGMDQPSIELELHLPAQPVGKQRLEIRIDRKAEETLSVTGNVYAVHFDTNGKALVNSSGFLQQWRKTYLVVGGRRLKQYDDFEVLKSAWKMANVTEKLPGGGVSSRTVEEGSVYWLELELLKPTDTPRVEDR